MNRDFDEWLSGFRETIADYEYYVDFGKVFNNVDSLKLELNILNSLIGSKHIEQDFEQVLTRYPETLHCIPHIIGQKRS